MWDMWKPQCQIHKKNVSCPGISAKQNWLTCSEIYIQKQRCQSLQSKER